MIRAEPGLIQRAIGPLPYGVRLAIVFGITWQSISRICRSEAWDATIAQIAVVAIVTSLDGLQLSSLLVVQYVEILLELVRFDAHPIANVLIVLVKVVADMLETGVPGF